MLRMLTAVLIGSSTLFAHALLLESSPGPNAILSGSNQHFNLRFNSRIDAERSRLALLLSGGSPRQLRVAQGKGGGEITTDANGLQPGSYRLQWQVLAVDGHITRGEIPFTVK